MIYEVLDALDQRLRDPVKGVNATITAFNARRGIKVPHVAEFQTWDVSKLPSEMKLPTLQQVWDGSPHLPIAFNDVWDGDHQIGWYYWTDESADKLARLNISATAYALRKVLDSCLGMETAAGGIVEITNVAAQVAGWTQPQDLRLYTYLAVGFTVSEKDTTT